MEFRSQVISNCLKEKEQPTLPSWCDIILSSLFFHAHLSGFWYHTLCINHSLFSKCPFWNIFESAFYVEYISLAFAMLLIIVLPSRAPLLVPSVLSSLFLCVCSDSAFRLEALRKCLVLLGYLLWRDIPKAKAHAGNCCNQMTTSKWSDSLSIHLSLDTLVVSRFWPLWIVYNGQRSAYAQWNIIQLTKTRQNHDICCYVEESEVYHTERS